MDDLSILVEVEGWHALDFNFLRGLLVLVNINFVENDYRGMIRGVLGGGASIQ